MTRLTPLIVASSVLLLSACATKEFVKETVAPVQTSVDGLGTRVQAHDDGIKALDGRVQGTYLHGLFTGDAFRSAYLAGFGLASTLAYEAQVERALDALADHVEAHLDVDAILAIARSRQDSSQASVA